MVKELLNSSYDKLEKVNPFMVLPQQLPIKLLLLHGLEDSMLDWRASSSVYYQLIKDKANRGKINLYFCRDADHGDLPFIADFVPNMVEYFPFKERAGGSSPSQDTIKNSKINKQLAGLAELVDALGLGPKQELKRVFREVEATDFDKNKLEKFKELPRVLQKLGSFGKDIRDKRITPNDEELKTIEEVIDAIYENNKYLLNSAPEIATAAKIRDVQPILSDSKTLIQQMREKNPDPDPSYKPKRLFLPEISPIEIVEKLTYYGLETKLIEKERNKYFEFDPLPNRPDLLSCEQKKVKVKIESRNCHAFYLGLPVNNVVDAANLVMLESGQPLHVFDYESLSEKKELVIRQVREGEVMVSLQNDNLILNSKDMIISSGEKIIDLAGIIGTRETAVNLQTRNILVECAFFCSEAIKLTTNRLNFATSARNLNSGEIFIYQAAKEEKEKIIAITQNFIEKKTGQKFTELAVSNFPVIERDLSFLFPEELDYNKVIETLRKVGGDKLVEVNIFDVYQNAEMSRKKQKSVSYHLVFQSSTETLENKEIEKIMIEIIIVSTILFKAKENLFLSAIIDKYGNGYTEFPIEEVKSKIESRLKLAPATGGASLLLGAASTGLVGVGVAATVEAVGEYVEINNNKGSTIKLSSEMNKGNNKLDEGCGDVLHLLIVKRDNYLKKCLFAGQQSCLITVAAANILCSCLEEKDLEFAQVLISNCQKMIDKKEYNLDSCPDFQVFNDIPQFPNRLECVSQEFKTFSTALEKVRVGNCSNCSPFYAGTAASEVKVGEVEKFRQRAQKFKERNNER
ncbi:11514_t:CDS:10 [Ambispora leptoticha]|uniref:Large ribosomal subunit protein bL31c n=1 Tax=Ambispora leptoticha TaxID=144679 RepID=A0A9N8VA38_9GLOM|nr:11514_t:CDS:10 [Ambispora leptoticha]